MGTEECPGCRAKSHHPSDEACNGCPCFNEGFNEGVRRLDNLRREQHTASTQVERMLAIQAEWERAEREDDEFRSENI